MAFVRFKHLRQMGIVTSWPHLYRIIEYNGFPAGAHLSDRMRVWDERDVEAWLASRGLEYPGLPEPRPKPKRHPLADPFDRPTAWDDDE